MGVKLNGSECVLGPVDQGPVPGGREPERVDVDLAFAGGPRRADPPAALIEREATHGVHGERAVRLVVTKRAQVLVRGPGHRLLVAKVDVLDGAVDVATPALLLLAFLPPAPPERVEGGLRRLLDRAPVVDHLLQLVVELKRAPAPRRPAVRPVLITKSRKRAVMFFGWVFFLILYGSPHVQCIPMGVHRACGEPDESGLTTWG